MEQQDVLTAINNLTRMVTALQSGMKDMGVAITKIQESQGASVVEHDVDPSYYNLVTSATQGDPDREMAATSGQTGEEASVIVGHPAGVGTPTMALPGSLDAQIGPESPVDSLAGGTTSTTAPKQTQKAESDILECPAGVEPPNVAFSETLSSTIETEAPADGGEGGASLETAPDQIEEEEVIIEESSAGVESTAEDIPPSPRLAEACDAASGLLEKALSEVRMMMDRLQFISVAPEQHECLTREIAAVHEEVATLAAVATEIRNEVRTSQEALANIAQSTKEDPAARDDFRSFVVEQNQALETTLSQLVRGAQDTTQEALSKGTTDLGNYLGAEITKFQPPLNAAQEAMGQVLGSIAGMKSKLLQTWGISLFWLAAIIIFIIFRCIRG